MSTNSPRKTSIENRIPLQLFSIGEKILGTGKILIGSISIVDNLEKRMSNRVKEDFTCSTGLVGHRCHPDQNRSKSGWLPRFLP